MGYKTDGSSHRNGIKNEKHLRKYLKEGAAQKLYGLDSNHEQNLAVLHFWFQKKQF